MDTALACPGRPATVHMQLPSGPQAPRHARQAAARLLASRAEFCPRGVAEDVQLVVSELVTNAVLHANVPPGGRGLKIVQALAADLHVSSSASGKQIVAALIRP
ncbi:ATP-binding protein [Streptomyces sp. NPDC086023]|uniref:ATP-binding protein n=1 Tax=Streptomyces sp. NPDC086023 TaxID=3365746 RepID=UPI0037D17141